MCHTCTYIAKLDSVQERAHESLEVNECMRAHIIHAGLITVSDVHSDWEDYGCSNYTVYARIDPVSRDADAAVRQTESRFQKRGRNEQKSRGMFSRVLVAVNDSASSPDSRFLLF